MQVCLVNLLFHWSAIWRHVRALGYAIVYPPSRLALNQRSISSHSTRLASIGNLRETLNHWPKEANDQCQTQGLTEEGGRHKTTVQPILNIQKEMQIKFVRKHTRCRKWEYSLLPQTFGGLHYGFIVLQTSFFYLRVRLVHCALPLADCILVLTRFLMGYIVSSFVFQRALHCIQTVTLFLSFLYGSNSVTWAPSVCFRSCAHFLAFVTLSILC